MSVSCNECKATDFRGYLGEPDECIMYAWCCGCGLLKLLQAAPSYYRRVAMDWPKFSDVMLAYSLGSGASGL